MSLIELKSLCFSYPPTEGLTPYKAVEETSLSIEAGEYVALVGPNGSGKSTLLRLMAGLLAPSSGSATVAGLEASLRANHHAVRSSLALVFQSPLDQIVSTVVEEDVAFGPENLGLARQEIERRVTLALEAVGLSEERRKPSLFLSAGQQQRLALAGALAMEPLAILFDEATSMLDPPSREALLDLMDGLAVRGTTLVHVTHDMAEASRAHRVIVMSSGSVVFDGPPEDLFGGPSPLALVLGLELPPQAAAARAFGLNPLPRESVTSLAGRIAGLLPESARAGARLKAASAGGPGSDIAEENPAFRLSEVSFSYLRGTMDESEALKEINLDLPRGASLALVGRTGSGKSSLLQLLPALAAPSQGKVRSLGRDTLDPDIDLSALRLSSPLAIQRPESALFEDFAADDVAFGPRNLGLSGRELVNRVDRWMNAVGLPFAEFRDRRCRTLSGGEKRRLALAGVLALEPEALLLDEPTQALDPQTRAAIMNLALEGRPKGSTLVMATHSMEEAAACDYVAVFSGGRLAAYGRPRWVFYEGYRPDWGIGRPFACRIVEALEGQGLSFEERPLTLRELASAIGRMRHRAEVPA